MPPSEKEEQGQMSEEIQILPEGEHNGIGQKNFVLQANRHKKLNFNSMRRKKNQKNKKNEDKLIRFPLTANLMLEDMVVEDVIL